MEDWSTRTEPSPQGPDATRWELVEANGGLFWFLIGDFRIHAEPPNVMVMRRGDRKWGRNDDGPGVVAVFDFEDRLWHHRTGPIAWVGNFDDDPQVELGVVDWNTPVQILELGNPEGRGNEQAEITISLATRDFRANLQTSAEQDFEALWNEHGPSASVAALSVIVNRPYNSFLNELRRRVSAGQSIYEAVITIKAE